jgi:hypothetical protein
MDKQKEDELIKRKRQIEPRSSSKRKKWTYQKEETNWLEGVEKEETN